MNGYNKFYYQIGTWWNDPLIRQMTFVEDNLTLILLTHNYKGMYVATRGRC